MNDRRQALLIVNPAASGVSPQLLERICQELATAGPVEVVQTERAGHATDLAAVANGHCDALYVFSGDGGYNEVVNGMSADLPVGFIPGGKTSVLPRALGLPRDPVACARRIAGARQTRTITLGRATFSSGLGLPTTSRRFAFAAGVGLDAEMVRAVDQRGRSGGKRAGDLAFVAEIGRALARRRVRLEPILAVQDHGRCAFAIVTNCDPYTYAGPLAVHATPEARFELGLDLVAPVRLTPLGLMRLLWWVLVRPTHPGSDELLYLHDCDRLVVSCDQPTPAELDGEDIGDVTEVVFEAERGALRVIV